VASDDGAILLIGRVERDPESPRARIRDEMRRWLARAGRRGKSGGGHSRAVLDECERRNLRIAPRRRVATFRTTTTPSRMVEGWRSKPGLSGIDLPEGEKAAILDQVLHFTAGEFGNNDAELESEEHYTLEGGVLREGPGLPRLP
jgi:hypothetical protein